MRQVEIVQMNLNKVTLCKIPKTSARTDIFQRKYLVGLYLLGFGRLNFQIWRLRKELGQRVRSYFSYKLRLLHELRDTSLSYLSKDKKDKK